MKNSLAKKLCSVSLAAFLLAAPAFQMTAGAQSLASTQKLHKLNGYIKPKVTPTRKGKALRKGSPNYPSSYDLRTLSRLTPVKDQGQSGACWAFAGIGSLESFLMPKEERDFSENNLKNNSGFYFDPNSGGNDYMTTAYFSRWDGPMNESDDPYDWKSTSSTSKGYTQKHIQDVLYLPSRSNALDNNEIKQCVTQYGAVVTSMYMSEGNDQLEAGYGKYHTYYSSKATEQDHEVDIVGWDDNFPASEFTDYENNDAHPAGNGAFIIKNSWGTGWGDSGYFYISYYDANLDYFSVFDNAESVSDYRSIYSSDPDGYVDDLKPSVQNNNAWSANVFTRKTGDNHIDAAAFYAEQDGLRYNVYVVPDYRTPADLAQSRVLVKSGTFQYGGYHTVKFDAPVALTGGKFAVETDVIYSSGATTITVDDNYQGYSVNKAAKPGISYYCPDSSGANWSDLTSAISNATACIKAFTTFDTTKLSYIDTPKADSYISGGSSSLNISGWSLNASGVKSVAVSLDGGSPVTAVYGSVRNDVPAQLPGFIDGSKCGYSASVPVDLSTLRTGSHTISVTTTGNDGSTQTISTAVTKAAQAMYVDAPSSGKTINGSLTVCGWAVGANGIKSVDIKIDSSTDATVTTGGKRPDIQSIVNTQGQYLDAGTSGFSTVIPSSEISNGRHTVMVTVTGNDGEQTSWAIPITQLKSTPIMCVDAPSGSYAKGGADSINVSGWALNQDGIASVTAKIDNGNSVNLTYGLTRLDVAKYYPSYNNAATSGFSGSVPMNLAALTAGRHNVQVTVTGKDGSKLVSNSAFYKAAQASYIDSPKAGSSVTGDLSVAGWGLNATGVKNVTVQLDSTAPLTLNENVSRVDVTRVVNGDGRYDNSDSSGFGTVIPAASIPNGNHTLTITVNGNDGEKSTSVIPFSEHKPAPIMFVDTPAASSSIKGGSSSISIVGWALNGSRVAGVTARMDNGAPVQIPYGLIRNDVLKACPGYPGGAACGFAGSIPVDLSRLSVGKHTIAVTATGQDGSSQTCYIAVYKAPQLLCVDSPSAGKSYSGDLTVCGWALNVSGIASISYRIDGSFNAVGVTGVLRRDVTKYVNGDGCYYNSDNSGFSLTIPAAAVPSGKHTLTVTATGNDGEATKAVIPFNQK